MEKEVLLVFVIAYLIGSISPGFILGKLLKGKDIRKLSPKYNTGATNVYYNVSPIAGILTALIDISKGFLVMYFSFPYLLKEELTLTTGFLAFLGHVFPFYLNFRGGTGVSVLAGTTLYTLGNFNEHYSLPKLLVFIAYSLTVSENLRERIKKLNIIRKIYRLIALVIPLIYIAYGKNAVLEILIPLTLFIFVLDAARLRFPRLNKLIIENLKFILKPKEFNKISTTTLLLISFSMVILAFPRKIALLAILFTIIGDMFAEIIGIMYGKNKIFHNKTIEGSLGCFVSCVVAGLLFRNYIPLFPNMIVIGSLAAALTELFSVKIDDNFTMPIITAIVLNLL